MQYLLLVYGEERLWQNLPPAEKARISAECDAYGEASRASGHLLAGAPLFPVATATTIRLPPDRQSFVLTDGPFAETKEALAGYHLVECRDLDEAIALGQRFPGLRAGLTIEVRPVMTDEA